MDYEIRETVYIATSAIVLSVVLGFLFVMNNITADIVSTRNEYLANNYSLEQYRKFGKYNGGLLSGEEVIECIRLFYNTGVSVYIETNDSNIVQRVFNLEEYSNPERQKYFDIVDDDNKYLLDWFSGKEGYKAYLLFNNENWRAKVNKLKSAYRLENAGSTIQSKSDALDNCYKPSGDISNVTGILIIDLNTWE